MNSQTVIRAMGVSWIVEEGDRVATENLLSFLVFINASEITWARH